MTDQVFPCPECYRPVPVGDICYNCHPPPKKNIQLKRRSHQEQLDYLTKNYAEQLAEKNHQIEGLKHLVDVLRQELRLVMAEKGSKVETVYEGGTGEGEVEVSIIWDGDYVLSIGNVVMARGRGLIDELKNQVILATNAMITHEEKS